MRDPVCGMRLKGNEPKVSVYLGCIYFFCSSICQHKFDAHPLEYLSESAIGA